MCKGQLSQNTKRHLKTRPWWNDHDRLQMKQFSKVHVGGMVNCEWDSMWFMAQLGLWGQCREQNNIVILHEMSQWGLIWGELGYLELLHFYFTWSPTWQGDWEGVSFMLEETHVKTCGWNWTGLNTVWTNWVSPFYSQQFKLQTRPSHFFQVASEFNVRRSEYLFFSFTTEFTHFTNFVNCLLNTQINRRSNNMPYIKIAPNTYFFW